MPLGVSETPRRLDEDAAARPRPRPADRGIRAACVQAAGGVRARRPDPHPAGSGMAKFGPWPARGQGRSGLSCSLNWIY